MYIPMSMNIFSKLWMLLKPTTLSFIVLYSTFLLLFSVQSEQHTRFETLLELQNYLSYHLEFLNIRLWFGFYNIKLWVCFWGCWFVGGLEICSKKSLFVLFLCLIIYLLPSFFFLSFFLLLGFPSLSISWMRPYLERCGACSHAIDGTCWWPW